MEGGDGEAGVTGGKICSGNMESEDKLGATENDMEATTEKWPPTENDIVKRAKTIAEMAQSMYLFTKGEGELKTTQDLFTQAEFFAEEANKSYKVVRTFSFQVSVFRAFSTNATPLFRIHIFRYMRSVSKRSDR